MANYNKKGDSMPKGVPFVPGDPRAGRPKDPDELKDLKKLTKGQLEALLYKILLSPPEELQTFNKTVLELWIASGAKHGIKGGDFNRLMQLVERLHGKVKDQVELTLPKPTLIKLPNGEALLMGSEEPKDE